LSWRATKIVCTLGPATDAPGVLEALVAAGMDVARINLSHGTLDEHARRIAQVRETSRKSAHAVAILADLPGPKYRLGEIPGGSRELRDGTWFSLKRRPLPTSCPSRSAPCWKPCAPESASISPTAQSG
jgi:pyruvate kinase